RKGETFGGIVDEMPEPFRRGQLELGVKSTYAVPIQVANKYWGMIGFDDCHQLTRRSEAELEALKTLAHCIGNAIDRDRTRKERESAILTRAAELEAYNRALEERDLILEATAAVSNVLLTDEDFDTGFHQAMKIIGEAVGTDRVGIAENLADLTETSPGHWLVIGEWTAPGITPVSQIHDPEPMQGTYAGAEQLYALHQRGDGFSLLTDQMIEPFRSSMAFVGVQTLHSVPIILRGSYWGTIVFGDCRQQRLRSSAELAALQTVADCIGNAIDRDRIRKEREAAAQTRATELETFNQQLQQRDSLLNSVNAAAQCLVATEDLSVALPAILQILGEGTRQCRAYILQNSQDEQTHELIFNLTLEWDAPGIPTKREAGGRFPVPINTFPDHLTAPLKAGRSTQFLASELDGLDKRDQGQALSLVGVPITVEGEWWGLLGLDDCIYERVWSEAEIAVLETAATSIGNALERDLTRKERETAASLRATELENHNLVLKKRDRILAATASAASSLLASEDFEQAVSLVLQTIGEALSTNEFGIVQTTGDPEDPASLRWAVLYKWDVEQGVSRATPEQPLEQGTCLQVWEWHQLLCRGHNFSAVLEEMPEAFRQLSVQLGIQARHGIPIFVAGQYWGMLGFSDQQGSPQRTSAEFAALETTAVCIGGAIEREQLRQAELLTRKAHEAAEREVLLAHERAARAVELETANQILSTRERWLDATAAAANELLANADVGASVDAALKTIGVNLGCDRIGIMQHFPEPTGLGTFRVLYEWDSPNTLPQIIDPELPANLFENWSRQLMSGHWVGGLVAELDEPFRSTMQELNTLSTYAVPMFVDAEFWGLMFMDHCKEVRKLTPAELAVFNTAATCVGSAIYRDQIRAEREQAERDVLLQQEREQAAQQQAAELAKANESLNRTIGALAENPELHEFLGLLLAELAQQTSACKTHLFLYDAETHTLKQHCTVEDGHIYMGAAPTNPDMFRHPIPADLTGAWQAILDAPNPLTFNDLGSWDENENDFSLWWPESIPWHRREGHRDVACARMKAGNQPIGFIGFAFRNRTSLTDGQLEFIQALTNQATLAIQLTHLAEQSQSAALVNERNRLAREIHDTLAQTFTGVSLQLEAVRGITTPANGAEPTLEDFNEAQTYIRRARDLARAGLSEARRSVRSLRSAALETDALPDALRKTLTQTTRDTGLETHFYLEGNPILLPDDIQLNLLRISQEAVTNTLRYAQATQLDLTLSFTSQPNQQVQLRVIDNGKGFDTTQLSQKSGFGLLGIRERTAHFGGTFELLSTPNIGTTLDIVIPLSP
ncbi:MAG: GAF domain-containing protein, partial [Cyanobacteria bacterium P01_A01_bin.17]